MKVKNKNIQNIMCQNVTPKEAIEIQKELRKEIRLIPLTRKVKTVGGADVSMNLFSTFGFAGFVTLTYTGSYQEWKLLDHSVVKGNLQFPYIPGLLSFREIPMLLKAWERLKQKPDVILVDGVGIAHPRRLGIATHLGILLDIPTIGCAKSVLTGTYKKPANEPGSFSYMYDTHNKQEIIGAALRTKRNVKPMFISPGHMITLAESIDIVKNCVRKHRLPEPTRIVHNTVNEYRIRDLNDS